MTAPPPPPLSYGSPDLEPQPGWGKPIALGAAITFGGSLLLLFLSQMLASAVPAMGMVSCCGCGLGFLIFGFVPAASAIRRDPRLTPGQGFAVSFIAVGIGSLVFAGVLVATDGIEAPDPTQLREFMVEANEGNELSDEEIDQVVDVMVSVVPFIPAIHAAVQTLFAGFVGLITVLLLRRRARDPLRQ